MSTVEQHRLTNGGYELAIKAQTGELRSFAVPGFVISDGAILDVLGAMMLNDK